MEYQSIGEMFFDRVRRYADKPAYQFNPGDGWKTVTWREYGERVRAFALSLVDLGIQKGDKVCVISNTRSEWDIADKAIAFLGGVTVGKEKMKIELVKADSNEFINLTDATNAMERLMTQDKVNFVVGGFRTEAVMAMQDIAMDYKKIFIGCGAAHDELCLRVAKDYNKYKYFFRGTPFNSNFLVQTSFIHMGTVGAIMKATLNIPQVKVAIAAEKAAWVDPMVAAAKGYIPKMGMEIAGVWRISPGAREVNAELSAIQREGAHIIFTVVSGPVGIPLAKQAGELKIPAIQVGINIEACKEGFWEATQGMGNYVMSFNNYARELEYNELTGPFVTNYIKRYGDIPIYTADVYALLKLALPMAIEDIQRRLIAAGHACAGERVKRAFREFLR